MLQGFQHSIKGTSPDCWWNVLSGLQLQRACEATAHELATATAGKVALQQQYEQAQESIDALAAELQDTLGKVQEKESDIQALAEQLEIEQRQNMEASQQVTLGA